jgi:penicillin-binding protein 1C
VIPPPRGKGNLRVTVRERVRALASGRAARAAALLIAVAAICFLKPPPRPLFAAPYSAVLEARDGRLLGARIAADGQWRFPEAPCPPRFARAAVVFEDSRFRRHPGVDPLAVLRALAANAKAGRVVSGASTLTMQVVRLSRAGRPRSFAEKAVEAWLALRLELVCGKDEILSLYAAHAPFGGNVVGLPAASWRYFGRGPEHLSWAEAALLAVLPNSPSLMHPGRNRERLREKRDRLLLRLQRTGDIDSVACRLARLEPLPERPLPLPRLAPHLLQTLAAGKTPAGAAGTAAAGNGSAREPGPPAGVWRTTLDADLQAQVNGILERRRRAWEGAGIGNAAVLVLHTRKRAARWTSSPRRAAPAAC